MFKHRFTINKTVKTESIKHKDMPTYLDSEDPVILKTSWQPLKGGGQSYKSHHLVQINDNRLEFRRGLAPNLIYSLVIAIGFFTLFLAFYSDSGNSNPFITVVIGILFVVVGLGLFYFTNKKMVLDKSIMAFWRGKQDAAKMINPHDVEDYHSLKAVHAVQLIKEYIDDDEGADSFYSHELNLIFSNGKRINLVDHKDNTTIAEQAQQVSEFLNIPLWDGRFDGVDGNYSKLHRIVSSVFSFIESIKLLIILLFATGFIYVVFFAKDPNPKQELSTLSGIEQIERNKQYTQELFDLVKQKNVNFPRLNKLVNTGIYLDSLDEDGRSPLFYATLNKNRDYMHFFIRAYADIHIKDKQGLGLKDLLDIQKDKALYFILVDAELEEKANARGKTVYQINRKFDKKGNVIYQKVLEK